MLGVEDLRFRTPLSIRATRIPAKGLALWQVVKNNGES